MICSFLKGKQFLWLSTLCPRSHPSLCSGEVCQSRKSAIYYTPTCSWNVRTFSFQFWYFFLFNLGFSAFSLVVFGLTPKWNFTKCCLSKSSIYNVGNYESCYEGISFSSRLLSSTLSFLYLTTFLSIHSQIIITYGLLAMVLDYHWRMHWLKLFFLSFPSKWKAGKSNRWLEMTIEIKAKAIIISVGV